MLNHNCFNQKYFYSRETVAILMLGYDRHDIISFAINCRLHFCNAVKWFHT